MSSRTTDFRRALSRPAFWIYSAFWLLLSTVIIRYILHPIHEPDIWWHLASGRAMLENKFFYRSDIFSHSIQGTPWINFEWLSQIIFYLAARVNGLEGVYLLKVILGLSGVFFLALCAHSAGARGPLLLLLTWLGYHLLQVRLCARVELFTLIFMGIFMLLLLNISTLTKKSPFLLGGLVSGLIMVWCNLHAGFIYGLGLLVTFAVGARWAKAPKQEILAIDASILFGAAASLVNPFGIQLYSVFLHVMKDFHQLKPDFLIEWALPTIRSAPYFWITLGVTILWTAYLIYKKDRSVLLWVPALLIFGFYGSRHIRSTVLFSFVAIPFLARSVSLRGRGLSWLVCVIPLLIEGHALTKKIPKGIIQESLYPEGAVRFIQENEIRGKMYNPLGMGGFIDWTLGPDRKVFVDGRYIFYPILAEEQKMMSDPQKAFNETAWKEFLAKYQIDHAIERFDEIHFKSADEYFRFRPVSTFKFPKKDWALVYWDDASLVFLKRELKFEELINQWEYRFAEPYNPGRIVFLSKQDPVLKKNVLKDLKRHQSEVGPTRRDTEILNNLSNI